jgi:7-carboxy-7-deazaguanine synthase (Cx14CxxC type)
MTTYSVKELYYTLQGEGAQTGRAAVFLRFAGCNLWNGLERDRASAVCNFCDTDFVGTDGPGGGKFTTPGALADAVATCWADATHETTGATPYVICTGGEPLLQLDAPLIDAFHQAGFEVGVETNGTLSAPAGLDWICVSPKADAALHQTSGDELKLVYPQELARPEQFTQLNFQHFFLQPLDGPEISRHTAAAIDYCRQHPQWRLSLQTHKLTGIP